jgi:nucleoside-diphosphate-sugar epimerase
MISVFGGTGFIGSRFSQMYRDQVKVIPRDTYKPSSKDILYLISTTSNYNVFDDLHVDIDTNLSVLMNVLKNCKEKNLVFNFVSSWFVYGKTEDLPALETSHCNPKGFYSITKRCAEQLIISYCETFGIKYRIFRLANVYGEGDNSVSKKKNALQFLINEVVNDRDINLYDGGKNIRDFIYVDDVCRAIYTCMKRSNLNEIINIGSGQPHQFLDLMNYCIKKTNSKSKIISVLPTEFHNIVQVKNMYLDVAKLRDTGFEQEVSINEGLDIIIKKYQMEKEK